MSCRALSHGMCKNGLHDTVDEIVDPVNEIADFGADPMDPSPICGESVAFDDFGFWCFYFSE